MSLQTVVEDCLRGLGYELVELEWHAGGQLRVFIEHTVGSLHSDGSGASGLEAAGSDADASNAEALAQQVEPISEGPIPEDGSGIRIEDCERVSHQLSHLLAVENFDYARLEVSSPGLDRPIRGQRDFERFVGSEITLKLKFAFAGRRNFEGLLCRGQDGQFELELIDRASQPAAGKKVGGKLKGKVKGVAKRGAKADASAGIPAGGAAVQPDAGSDSALLGQAASGEQGPVRLKFALDEIERARLVPKFKF